MTETTSVISKVEAAITAAETKAQKTAPLKSLCKTPAAPKVKKPTEAKKAADTSKQTPAKADKVAKSGKVETSLTPTEKAKRLAQLTTVTESVRKETSNIANAYMRIGYQLWQAKEYKLYLAAEVDGKPLKNVYEYAEMAFGFKKSSAINFIAVCERFSLRTPTDHPTDQINPAFAMFAFTQLREMLPLSDDKLSDISPEMSSREIKSLKSDHSSGQNEDGDTDTADTDKPTRKVAYDGMCNMDNLDRITDKLESLFGKKIQIIVVG